MLQFIVFFACVVLAVVLGEKLKINAGFLAIAFAFALGFIFLQMTPAKVVANFPTTLFFNILITTAFYGFAALNGTMENIARHIMYAFRNAKWAVGIVLYVAIFVVSALGAGAAATAIIMSPFAFAVAKEMGYDPLIASVSVWGASAAGSGAVWGTNTATMLGLFSPYIEDQDVLTNYVNLTFIWKIILYFVFFLLVYFFLKGHKGKGDISATATKPEPMNKEQKVTFAIIICVIFFMAVPPIIRLLAGKSCPAFIKWMASYLTTQSLCAFGIFLNMIFKVGNVKDVIAKKVPWNMITIICGMSMLMSLTEPMGVTEILSNWLQALPSFLIIPGLVLITSILSFFVSAYVINPMFAPLMTALMAAAGVGFEAVGIAFAMGAFASSISPFSTGGAMALIGCPDEETRNSLVTRQVKLSFVSMAYFVLISATGVFTLFNLK